MNENKCLGYPLSVAGHTIKVNGCRNMAQLLEQDARISALETENAALRGRLEFTSCQKADVEAQVLELEEENAALRKDAAVGRELIPLLRQFIHMHTEKAIEYIGDGAGGLLSLKCEYCGKITPFYPDKPWHTQIAEIAHNDGCLWVMAKAALAAAELMEGGKE